MPLTAGSVTVANDGTVTKSGEAEQLFDLLEELAQETIADFPGQTLPTGSEAVPRLRGQARLANKLSSWIFDLLTVRARTKVATTDSALQRTPDPNNANTDTQGPTADKFLSIV